MQENNTELKTSAQICEKVNEVKIGWKIFDIYESEPCESGGDLVYGYIDHYNSKIFLKQNMDKNQYKVTFLHEILHGIDDIYCFNFSEQTIKRLANCLYEVIKDNAELFKKVLFKEEDN